MKIEVVIERQRRPGVWAQHAKGKFSGEPDAIGEQVVAWLESKGLPQTAAKAAGWGVNVRVT